MWIYCIPEERGRRNVYFSGAHRIRLVFWVCDTMPAYVETRLPLPCFRCFAFPQQLTTFKDPNATPEARAADLVANMTLEEKVSQMQNTAAEIKRLGIPAYDWWNEGLHGVARAGLATVFPQAIGVAATFDTDLMHRIATTISTEGRAKYNDAVQNGNHGRYFGLTFWSPNINIFRDPRWGRGQETYGEDPYLTSRLAVAFIQGIQGDDPHYFKADRHGETLRGPQRTGDHAPQLRRDAERSRPQRHLPARLRGERDGGEGLFRDVRL